MMFPSRPRAIFVPTPPSSEPVRDYIWINGPPLEQLANAICRDYRITMEELRQSNGPIPRMKQVIWARRAFCKRAYATERYSYAQLAKYLGYKDHTSVVHLVNSENSYV
jgi:chromosomal replication initiation ATPase DnaA